MNKEIKKRSANKFRTYKGDKKPVVKPVRSANKYRTYRGDGIKTVKQELLKDSEGNKIQESRVDGEYKDTIFNTTDTEQPPM